MELGKKVYRSTAIGTIKLMALLVIVVLFINLYLSTFNDPEFSTWVSKSLMDVAKFHLQYPYDILSFIFFILGPCHYYGFVRGVSFYENGMIINKGLPFFNVKVPYKEIERYEIIHSRLFISIKRRDTGEDILFSVNDVDRAISIFDQNNIQGDLSNHAKETVSVHTKLVLFFIVIGVAVMLGQSLGLSRFLFR